MLGHNQCEPWLCAFWSSPGLHLSGWLAGKGNLISDFERQYKIPVVLVRTGYINLTRSLETQIAWVTHWKWAQMSLSSPARRLALVTALQLDIWAGGEVAIQQRPSSPRSACWPLWTLLLHKYRRTSAFFQFVSSPPRAKCLKVKPAPLTLKTVHSTSLRTGKFKLELHFLAAWKNLIQLRGMKTVSLRIPWVG